jgi:predicted DNA repair protein MutK
VAGTSLIALIDDIATILDDVAVMTKVAAKKTAGVLGDDLALNAQQVTGVSAEREIPVVWAVAKGSLKNKAILVPAAILISLFLPWAITPLLMIGGAYLCFEGAEKLVHKFIHSKEEINEHHAAELNAVKDLNVDLVEFEKKKIKGAIRTDFILSAEIIAITLGTTADASLLTQAAVLTVIALVMTIGVYGLVGGLVKIDDLGLHLFQAEGASSLKRNIGSMLLSLAPKLMKFLSIAGTIAMFLVGGGILVHGITPVHHLFEHWQELLAHAPSWISWSQHLFLTVMNGLLGIIAGGLLVLAFNLIQPLIPSKTSN